MIFLFFDPTMCALGGALPPTGPPRVRGPCPREKPRKRGSRRCSTSPFAMRSGAARHPTPFSKKYDRGTEVAVICVVSGIRGRQSPESHPCQYAKKERGSHYEHHSPQESPLPGLPHPLVELSHGGILRVFPKPREPPAYPGAPSRRPMFTRWRHCPAPRRRWMPPCPPPPPLTLVVASRCTAAAL